MWYVKMLNVNVKANIYGGKTLAVTQNLSI